MSRIHMRMRFKNSMVRARRLYTFLLFGILMFGVIMIHELKDADDERIVTTEEAVITTVTNHKLIDQERTKSPLVQDLVYYKKDIPLTWIGGVPRSGTTLMRAMLDAHPHIRCGEETRVIPRLLGMHSKLEKSQSEMERLQEAKINTTVLNSALGAYMLSIIAHHGDPAPHLCNKDPFTLRSMSKIQTIFPQSKFLLMIRDGRATVHSIISRKVSIKGFDTKSYRGALANWNRAISNMYTDCIQYGQRVCMPVYYEQLVLHPETQMRRILQFLDIPWSKDVLHHELTIGKKNGVSLSKNELSTDQVNKPVNTVALTSWADHIPEDVRADIDTIAPMLRTLGYHSHAYPPYYGTPDKQVEENTKLVEHIRAL